MVSVNQLDTFRTSGYSWKKNWNSSYVITHKTILEINFERVMSHEYLTEKFMYDRIFGYPRNGLFSLVSYTYRLFLNF